MKNPLVRGPVLAGMAMALCCVGLTGAADPDAFGDGESPPPLIESGASSTWPPPWIDGSADQTEQAKTWPEAEAEIVRMVNEERSQAGCDPLSTDGLLSEAAREHSQDLAQRGTLSLANFFEDSSAGERARDKGYERTSGEIVASGFETAEKAVQAWTRSPGHSKVLLDCGSVETGVGVVLAEGGPYWTQILGYGSPTRPDPKDRA